MGWIQLLDCQWALTGILCLWVPGTCCHMRYCISLLTFLVLLKCELLEVTEHTFISQECIPRVWHTWQAFRV